MRELFSDDCAAPQRGSLGHSRILPVARAVGWRWVSSHDTTDMENRRSPLSLDRKLKANNQEASAVQNNPQDTDNRVNFVDAPNVVGSRMGISARGH